MTRFEELSSYQYLDGFRVQPVQQQPSHALTTNEEIYGLSVSDSTAEYPLD